MPRAIVAMTIVEKPGRRERPRAAYAKSCRMLCNTASSLVRVQSCPHRPVEDETVIALEWLAIGPGASRESGALPTLDSLRKLLLPIEGECDYSWVPAREGEEMLAIVEHRKRPVGA